MATGETKDSRFKTEYHTLSNVTNNRKGALRYPMAVPKHTALRVSP